MSNKVSRIADDIKEQHMEEKETKSMTIRVDVCICKDNCEFNKSTYIVITGIPKDLPEEFESSVIKTAEGQFSQALSSRIFLEFYSPGKSAKDERPTFINLSKIDSIKIENIEKII